MELRDDITIRVEGGRDRSLFLSLSPNRRIRDAQPKRQKKKEAPRSLRAPGNISYRPLRSAEHVSPSPTLHVSMHSSLGNKVRSITNKVREKRRLCASPHNNASQPIIFLREFPAAGFFFLSS